MNAPVAGSRIRKIISALFRSLADLPTPTPRSDFHPEGIVAMKTLVPALVLSLGLAVSVAQAQLPAPPETGQPTDFEGSDERYYDSSQYTKPTPQEIIQYKAQLRAQQRMTRMASMEWYGMSASRPRASVTPFTGLYSPIWQMPGGRPMAWTPSRFAQPVIIVR
jgi:hypothetical protein